MARRTSRTDHSLAIIGMSGRFPGAPSIERFWENLRHGVESITPFSRGELQAAGVDPAAFDNPAYVSAGSVLEDVDLFDAPFFGFSPREAESLDPQHRLFLETAWHALEDAGYDPATFPGLVGVYGGCAMSSYLDHLQSNPEFMALLGYLQVHIGNDKDYLTTRVSYKLDLKGPSFSIQTACSTSLLAVAVAGDHLLSRQCDMALAGGVCVRVPQKSGYYFEPGGIFSPDGHCRVFDENAAGVVFGNGVGVVVLRRLADALADGDPIYAVVKGWAVNNDGAAKGSFAAPSLDGQVDVIARAHAHAGVRADTITYVEAHGTGTSVGDPVEIGALTKAFRASTTKKGFCAVGSVKTNVGHLDPAAGVASLIKTILALEHREIPPSLNCDTINPAIDFANSPFFVNRELMPWAYDKGPRRAGVSGFGIGGTNVHLVLEEAPAVEAGDDPRRHHLLVLSARSPSALQTMSATLAEQLTVTPGMDAADVAYTLQVGRRAKEHRCAAVYTDADDLVAALAASDGSRIIGAAGTPRERAVAFMFSGQGAQYVNMARGLYDARAGIPCRARPLRGAARAPALARSAHAAVSAGSRCGGRADCVDADGDHAARAVRDRVRADAAVDAVGRAARRDDRTQHRRARRRVRRGRLLARGRPGAGRRTGTPDAGRGARCDGRRLPSRGRAPLASAVWPRPGRGERGRTVRRLGAHRRDRGVRAAARGRRRPVPAPPHLARVPLADDGRGRRRVRRLRSASSRRRRLAFRTSPTSRATGSPQSRRRAPSTGRNSCDAPSASPTASARFWPTPARFCSRSGPVRRSARSRAGIPTATTRSSSSRLCRGPRRASQTTRSPSRRSAGCGSQASRSTGRACTRATRSPTSPSARVPVRAPSLLGGCGGARAERACDRAEGARCRRLVLRADVGVRARSHAGAADASRSSGSCSARATSSGARSPAGCSMPDTT